MPKVTEPESKELGRAPKAGQGLSCLPQLPSRGHTHPAMGRGRPLKCPPPPLTATKGSWCEQQLCACDKMLAFCLQRNLNTYKSDLRYLSSCEGETPECQTL